MRLVWCDIWRGEREGMTPETKDSACSMCHLLIELQNENGLEVRDIPFVTKHLRIHHGLQAEISC